MLVNITQTFDDLGRRWFIGDNPDVDPQVARRWIADGKATADPDNAQPNLGGLTYAQVQAAPALQAFQQPLDFANLPEPWFVTHAGAGRFLAPSLYADSYQMGLSFGTGVVDGGDWRVCSDTGTDPAKVVMFHDATLDALTTSTGTVSATLFATVRAAVVDASSWFGGGWSDKAAIMIPDEFFDKVQGRACLTPEPKDTTAASIMAPYMARRGLVRSVCVNAFSDAMLAPFANAGFPYLWRNLAPGSEHSTFDAVRAAALLALGIRYLGVDASDANAPTVCATARAAGMKVIVGIVNRQRRADEWLARGVVGVVSDDPVYAARRYSVYRSNKTAFGGAAYTHGEIQKGELWDPALRGTFSGGRRRITATSSTNWFNLAGPINPIANAAGSYTITTSLTVNTRATDARWGPTWVVGAPDDLPYDESGSTSNGVEVTIRPSQAAGGGSVGQVRIRVRNAGVGSGDVTGNLSAELVAGNTITLTIAVTPTTVTATVSGAATGAATLTDSTWRGGYVHYGVNFNSTGGVFDFGDFTVA